ncbi:MAG: hypothetical protein ABFS56_22840 [Pseudomonadota bacterium]
MPLQQACPSHKNEPMETCCGINPFIPTVLALSNLKKKPERHPKSRLSRRFLHTMAGN